MVTMVSMMAVIGRRGVAAALAGSPGGIIGWQALDNAVAGKHTAVDREVAAHHEGAHGCVLLG